jgi:hypothetical protein
MASRFADRRSCTRVGRAIGAGLSAWLVSSSAFAFKEPGHRVIEKIAYEQLIATGNGDVLVTLVKAGALRGGLPPKPAANPASPEDYIGLREGDVNVQGVWVGSHIPDHSFNRQLQSYGQCFHFNARGGDVLGSARENGMPVGLVRDAYLRCMSLMDILVRGLLADPADANQRGLGLYTLMHMVTDSFSEAHVARERDWDILYVKPWRLRTWASYLVSCQQGWKDYVTDNHHGIIDERDYDYVRKTPECEAQRDDPGTLSAACLSSRAKRAADAIVDLLVLVSAYIEHPPTPRGGARSLPGFEQDWTAYRKLHFQHADARYAATLSDRELGGELAQAGLVARSTVIEEKPPEAFGVGVAFDLQNAMDNVWIEGNVFYGSDAMKAEDLGLRDYLTHTIQLRLPFETTDGQRPLAIAYEPGVRIPGDLVQTDWMTLQVGLRLRFAYGVSRVSSDETRHTFEAGFGGFSFDAVFKRYFWVGIVFPRMVGRLDTWGPEQGDMFWTMKTGVAFGGS